MKKITVPKIISLVGLAATGASTSFLTSCSSKGISEAHIISINDFHGAVGGVGDKEYCGSTSNPGVVRLIKEVDKIKQQYPGSIFVSAGDNNSGDTFSSSTKGETLYPVLKATGVQYSAVGNHAFEWGVDGFIEGKYDKWGRTDETSGKYFLASNILHLSLFSQKQWAYHIKDDKFLEDYQIWLDNKAEWADPWKLVDLNGHTVCLIGLTTQKTLEDGNRAVTSQLSFMDYSAAVAYSKYNLYTTIGDTWYNKIESFILLTHVGCGEDEQGAPNGEAVDFAKDTDVDFDAIIAAHTHKVEAYEVYNRYNDKNIWIGQAGTAGRYILDTKLEFDDSKRVGHRLKSIHMEPKKVPIDYGGHDVKSKNPEEVRLAVAAATQEYEKILTSEPSSDLEKSTRQAFFKQKAIVTERLQKQLGFIDKSLWYKAAENNVGHQYYYDDQWTNEPLGAFDNYAHLIGFRYWSRLPEQRQYNYPVPAIAFNNQDSITTQIKLEEGQATKDITLKHMYDLEPHDNATDIGYITIPQLWNIINYILSGTSEDERQGFSYEDNRWYGGDETGAALIADPTDPTGERKCINNTSADIKSKYLCGPLSWHGFRFEVEEETDETIKKQYCRDYHVKYDVKTIKISGKDVEVNMPHIWIYDPEKPSCSLENPATWPSAEEWINTRGWENCFICCYVNNFVYDGGNKQARMFAPYFTDSEVKWIGMCNHIHLSQLSRDYVELYCEYMNSTASALNDNILDSYGTDEDKMFVIGSRH